MERIVHGLWLFVLAAGMMFAHLFGALFLGCANNFWFALLIATIATLPSLFHPTTLLCVAAVIVLLVGLADPLKTARRRRWWALGSWLLLLASALVGMQMMLHAPKGCDLQITWR